MSSRSAGLSRAAVAALLLMLALSAPVWPATASAAQADAGTQNSLAIQGPNAADVPQCIYLFYDSGCQDCQEVKAFLEALEANSTWLTVHYFEIRNYSNWQLMVDFYRSKNMSAFEVPVVFIGNEVLLEVANIETSVPLLLANKTGWMCPSMNSTIPDYEPPSTPPIAIIFGMAFADSLNPCAISVLLLLVVALSVSSISVLKTGIAYILGNFVAYFLIGIGLFSTLNLFTLPAYTSKIIAILAIAVAVISLFSKLPKQTKPIIKSIISAITSPYAAFAAGAVISVIELPCSGGPYFLALTLMSQYLMSQSEVLIYLVIYNMIFVLPLVAVLVFYSATKSVDIPRNYIRYASAAIMVIMGIALFLI
jgi:cytochrome c biogenesis protein CcdA